MNFNRFLLHSIYLILYLIFIFSCNLKAQNQLEWEKRENPDRFEGVKTILKSSNLELLSAKAVLFSNDQNIEINMNSKFLYLYFFVPLNIQLKDSIFLTVREYKFHNYWMQPTKKSWKSGWQSFKWPLNEVLLKLDSTLDINQLAAVARVGNPEEKYSRTLIPTFIVNNKILNNRIEKYQFIVLPPDNADILQMKCEWYYIGQNSTEKVGEWVPNRSRLPAGRPLYINMEFTGLLKGWYKVVLNGKLDYPSYQENLNEVYVIYHQPVLE